MGILGRRGDGDEIPGGSRYQMREKLLSIGDDYWIEDGAGEKAFRVDGKAMRIRKTFVLEDPDGTEVAKIQERKLSVRDKMAIERGGHNLATVRKALIGIRDRFSIDLARGGELRAKGNIVDHEYEIERNDGNYRRPRLQEMVPRARDLRHRDRPEAGCGPPLGHLGLHRFALGAPRLAGLPTFP
jgi:uncharacterized protein YxjI